MKKSKSTKLLSNQPFSGVHRTRIRVIGIGGGGGSIVSEIAPRLKRADFVIANTDFQALKGASKIAKTFQFGQKITRNLGCGMDPKLGQKAALEAKDKIAKFFHGIDLTILVATLGGGTGSGAVPEFAKIAKEMGVMTFGIFTLPFKFEGSKKAQIAKNSLVKIIPHLNTFYLIPNENIFKIIEKSTPIKEAFSAINNRLTENLRGLIEMVYLPGLINIDWADLRTILEDKSKLSYLNIAFAKGANRAEEATKNVLKSPLNEYSITGAKKIIYNITASRSLEMKEVEHISQAIADFNKRAQIIFGVSQDNNYKDKIRIALLGVGCEEKSRSKPKVKSSFKPKPEPKPKPKPEPEPEPETKSKLKPKKKFVKKPKLKSKKIKKVKEVKIATPKLTKEDIKSLTRKSALDLRKEAEQTEKDLLEQEKQWDIPAFLRKRVEEN